SSKWPDLPYDAWSATCDTLHAAPQAPNPPADPPGNSGYLPRPSREPRQQRVDLGEAALRSLLDAVLHRRVALLGRLEAHRLGQLRPVAQIFELERLQVVLERLHEPR